MSLMHCKRCGEKTSLLATEHFQFCSPECKTADVEEDLANRREQAKTHSPWSRFSEETRAELREMLNTSGPAVWTKELIEAEEAAELGAGDRVRADGEADGRAAGNRKCGRCGENGHNARTCQARELKAHRMDTFAASMKTERPVDVAVSGGEATPPSIMGSATRSPNLPGAAPRMPVKATENIPAPRSLSERTAPRTAAGAEPKLKTCGKCGGKGHNARTCGQPPKKVEIVSSSAQAPRSVYICGKCGKGGHNARTCAG